jgi:hypothetical protein
MTQVGFNRDRAAKIIEEAGGLSLDSWTRACIADGGVFSGEFQAVALFKHARVLLGHFSREDDTIGLPRFGPTTMVDADNQPLYVQRNLWDESAWLLNIEHRVTNAMAVYRKTMRMIEAYEDRFGKVCTFRPSMEQLCDLKYDDDPDPAVES